MGKIETKGNYFCRKLQLPIKTLYQKQCRQNVIKSKKTSNDQELIQSDPTSCPQNQKGNN